MSEPATLAMALTGFLGYGGNSTADGGYQGGVVCARQLPIA